MDATPTVYTAAEFHQHIEDLRNGRNLDIMATLFHAPGLPPIEEDMVDRLQSGSMLSIALASALLRHALGEENTAHLHLSEVPSIFAMRCPVAMSWLLFVSSICLVVMPFDCCCSRSAVIAVGALRFMSSIVFVAVGLLCCTDSCLTGEKRKKNAGRKQVMSDVAAMTKANDRGVQLDFTENAGKLRRLVGVTAHMLLRLREGLPLLLLFYVEGHIAAAYIEKAEDGVLVDVYDSLLLRTEQIVSRIAAYFEVVLNLKCTVSTNKHKHQQDGVSCSLHAVSYLLHRSAGFHHIQYCAKGSDETRVIVQQLRALALEMMRADVPRELLDSVEHSTTATTSFRHLFNG